MLVSPLVSLPSHHVEDDEPQVRASDPSHTRAPDSSLILPLLQKSFLSALPPTPFLLFFHTNIRLRMGTASEVNVSGEDSYACLMTSIMFQVRVSEEVSCTRVHP
jgi:hypothetical protein